MDFVELVSKAGRNKEHEGRRILSLDPGHTTGWAFFTGCLLSANGQMDCKTIPKTVDCYDALLTDFDPEIVVMEDYRIYKWKAKHHAGSEMLTTRIIGCLEALTYMYNDDIPIIKQPAHVAKGFCTDDKLRDWDFYVKGHRHARDAIRHGCYYILFGGKASDGGGQTTVG